MGDPGRLDVQLEVLDCEAFISGGRGLGRYDAGDDNHRA
jgi:hypothetical protein